MKTAAISRRGSSRRNSDSGLSSSSSVGPAIFELRSVSQHKKDNVIVAQTETSTLDHKSSKFQPVVRLENVFMNKIVSEQYDLPEMPVKKRRSSKTKSKPKALPTNKDPSIQTRTRGRPKSKSVKDKVNVIENEVRPSTKVFSLTISANQSGRTVENSVSELSSPKLKNSNIQVTESLSLAPENSNIQVFKQSPENYVEVLESPDTKIKWNRKILSSNKIEITSHAWLFTSAQLSPEIETTLLQTECVKRKLRSSQLEYTKVRVVQSGEAHTISSGISVLKIPSHHSDIPAIVSPKDVSEHSQTDPVITEPNVKPITPTFRRTFNLYDLSKTTDASLKRTNNCESASPEICNESHEEANVAESKSASLKSPKIYDVPQPRQLSYASPGRANSVESTNKHTVVPKQLDFSTSKLCTSPEKTDVNQPKEVNDSHCVSPKNGKIKYIAQQIFTCALPRQGGKCNNAVSTNIDNTQCNKSHQSLNIGEPESTDHLNVQPKSKIRDTTKQTNPGVVEFKNVQPTSNTGETTKETNFSVAEMDFSIPPPSYLKTPDPDNTFSEVPFKQAVKGSLNTEPLKIPLDFSVPPPKCKESKEKHHKSNRTEAHDKPETHSKQSEKNRSGHEKSDNPSEFPREITHHSSPPSKQAHIPTKPKEKLASPASPLKVVEKPICRHIEKESSIHKEKESSVFSPPIPKQTDTHKSKSSSNLTKCNDSSVQRPKEMDKPPASSFSQMPPPRQAGVRTTGHHHQNLCTPTYSPYCNNKSSKSRSIDFLTGEENPRNYFKDDDQLSIFVSEDLQTDIDQCVSENLSQGNPKESEANIHHFNLQRTPKKTVSLPSESATVVNNLQAVNNLGCIKLPTRNLFTSGAFRDCKVAGNQRGGMPILETLWNSENKKPLPLVGPSLVNAVKQPVPAIASACEDSSHINTWINNSNGQPTCSPVQMLKNTCRYYKSCYKWQCSFSHHFPPFFSDTLNFASEQEVLAVYMYIMKKGNNQFIDVVLPMIINYHSAKRNDQTLLGITDDVLRCTDIEKSKIVQLIIEGLTGPRIGYSFNRAIFEVVMYIGMKNNVLSDILMTIIVQKDQFLANYWELITRVTKFRSSNIDFGIIDDILKACIDIDKGDSNATQYITNVCQDLLLKEFVDVSLIAVPVMTDFLSKMKQLHMKDMRREIKNLYRTSVDFEFMTEESEDEIDQIPCNPETAENTAVEKALTVEEQCPCATNSQIGLCNHDIAELRRILTTNDSAGFTSLIMKCSISMDFMNSLLLNIIMLFKQIGYKDFYELYMETIVKLELDTIAKDVKKLVLEIGFNILPFYDKGKDYKSAANIIKFFFSDIDQFLMCKCFYNEEPYRSNLRDDPQKLVFFIKLLTRGGHLEQASTCIKMEGFQIDNNDNSPLFKYKTDIVKEFLYATLKSNMFICKDILHYLLETKSPIVVNYDLETVYNKYLTKIINASTQDKSVLKEEFREFASQNCHHIDRYLLRAIMTILYQDVPITELVSMYQFCCRKDIYCLQMEDDCLCFKSNMCIQEIKLIFHMYLLNMLQKKCPPKDVDLQIREVKEKVNAWFGDFRIPGAVDKTAMSFRLVGALISFQTTVNITDLASTRLYIPQNIIKHCLEEVRREVSIN